MTYFGPDVMRTAVGVAARGGDRDRLELELERRLPDGLPGRRGPDWLDELLATARTYLAGRTEEVEDLLGPLEQAAAQPWTGVRGATDLAVLQAVCGLARRWTRFPVAASVGEVSVCAGVSRRTVQRSLQRLVADGWLERVAEPTPVRAAVYGPGPLAGRVDPRCPAVHVDLGHDAARAVGRTQLRVWELLGPSPRSTAELAAELGRATGTVRRHLCEMRKVGLSELDGRGWVRGPAGLDAVARQGGTAGRRRRERSRLQARRTVRARGRALGAPPP